SVKHTTQQAAEYTYLVAKKHKCLKQRQQNLKWEPPKENFYKLNTNGAHTTTTAGIGGIIQNSKAEWMLGFTAAVPGDSSTSAKLHALLQGLRIAYDYNFIPLEVEVDAQEIIRLFLSNTVSFDNLLTDCRYFLNRLGKPIVQHAYREHNRITDHLAKVGCNFGHNSAAHILENIPDFACQVFEEDKNGMQAQTTVQGHVLEDFSTASAKSDAIPSICNSNIVDNSITVGLYNSLLPSTSRLSCNRMQYTHPSSVRIT
ncbi:hypothetical protein A4A49_61419, partial [Nicotiana attenuata]